MDPHIYINAAEFLTKSWPSFLPKPSDASLLKNVWMEPLSYDQFTEPSGDQSTEILALHTALWFETDFSFSIPGIDAFSIAFAGGSGGTLIPVDIEVQTDLTIRIEDIPIALRFRGDLLKPVRKVTGNQSGVAGSWEPDPTRQYVEIALAKVTIEINSDGAIAVKTGLEIDLPPAMIGDTGVVVEARDIGICLDSTNPPAGKPAGWKGIHIGRAAVHLPGGLSSTIGALEMTNAYIGNGGFSGTVSDTWPTAIKTQFFGVDFTLQHAEVTFVQNALIATQIAGQMTLPFFKQPVPVDIGLNLNGGFAVRLTSLSGLQSVSIPGVLTMELDSLGFEIKESVFAIKLGGNLTPQFPVPGMDSLKFRIQEMVIDSAGNVSFDGGWPNLPKQQTFDFYGFQMEITKIGFGSEKDGTKWIGFSGGIKLVDGLPIGASVEGLRISWDDGGFRDISLNGIGVQFEIAEVLRFTGAVSFFNENDNQYFKGAIKLELISLGFSMDAALLIGKKPDHTYFYIFLDVQLPVGIPLSSTGLALYGMAGLFADNMEPGKGVDEGWYDNPDGSAGWYRKSKQGVTDVDKWKDQLDSLALGAGVTISTFPDSGYAFSSSVLLVIVIPGPVILLEGRAQILKSRASLGEDAPFHTLVVIDGRTGSFLFNVDATYRLPPSNGLILDAHAGAEGFFAGPNNWHFYLGQKDPRDKRIRAQILTIYESNSYFMLDANKVEMGSYLGYGRKWSFGPVGATLEAWIEGGAIISWKPVHFAGYLWLHGAIGLKVFWFSFGLRADARIEVETPTPWHILVMLSVEIDLPWFLPDIGFTIKLEWGSGKDRPPIPLPLKEIAVGHLKVTDTWASPLLPDYASKDQRYENQRFWDGAPHNITVADEDKAKQDEANPIIVVPMDGRPALTFDRPIHDLVMGVSPTAPAPEAVGETSYQYELVALKLEKRPWDGPGNWEPVVTAGKVTEVKSNGDGTVTVITQNYLQAYPQEPPFGQFAGGTFHAILPDGAGEYKVRDLPVISHTNGPNYTVTVKDAKSELPIGKSEPFGFSMATENHGPLYGQWQAASDHATKLILWSKNPFDFVCAAERRWSDIEIDSKENFPCLSPKARQQICVDFDDVPVGTIFPTTFSHHGLTFVSDQAAEVTLSGNHHVLHLASRLTKVGIKLPDPAAFTTVLTDRTQMTVTAFYRDVEVGKVIDEPSGEIVLVAAQGTAIDSLALESQEVLMLVRVCFLPLQAQVDSLATMTHNNGVQREVERWYGKGYVFDPNSWYRLEVITRVKEAPKDTPAAEEDKWKETAKFIEYGYFRTEGPPGLVALKDRTQKVTSPNGVEENREYDHPLTDLSLYVTPRGRTIPGDEQRPQRPGANGQSGSSQQAQEGEPPRPVYCGYDVGLEFNENYIEQMYRMAGRDLALYIYDNNQRPVRDALERLVVLPNYWGKTSDLNLSFHDELAIDIYNRSTCVQIDTTKIERNDVLGLGGERHVLRPETLHEVRVLPLLLREDFSSGDISKWTQVDEGDQGAKPDWKVQIDSEKNYYLQQSSDRRRETSNPVEKPGAYVVYGDEEWTDYRLSVTMRALGKGAIGVMFNFTDKDNYCRFSMSKNESYRQLISKKGSQVRVLAEDNWPFKVIQSHFVVEDYQVMVEAVGGHIRVYMDGELLFDVQDKEHTKGKIGLYTWGAPARFDDVRIDDFRSNAAPADDFRSNAAPVYRFEMITSRYVDFAHHLHSFQDRVWGLKLDSPLPADVAAQAGKLLEAKPFYDLLNLGQRSLPQTVEIALLYDAQQCYGLLLESPEPLCWARLGIPKDVETASVLWRADRLLPPVTPPKSIKLIGSHLTSKHRPIHLDPNQEYIELMLRDDDDLNGYIVQHLRTPGSIEPVIKEKTLFADELLGNKAQWQEVDEGAGRPKYAVAGDATWTDYQFTVQLRSDMGSAIGILFRYQDDQQRSYYRFSLESNQQRLVKYAQDAEADLQSNAVPLNTGHIYTVTIDAFGDRLQIYLDGLLLFAVTERGPLALTQGKIGLYGWDNAGNHFGGIAVRAIPWKADILFADEFRADWGTGWQQIDEGTIDAPSTWRLSDKGLLCQESSIRGPDPDWRLGTYQFAGSDTWTDYRFSVRLQSDTDGVIGVMFRYTDSDTYYRFLMDRQLHCRRLERILRSGLVVLWEDSVDYEKNQEYVLAIDAFGARLRGSLNGVPVFDIVDDDSAALTNGKIALYCCDNVAVWFGDVRVNRSLPAEQVLLAEDFRDGIDRWIVVDEGTPSPPAAWSVQDGMLIQTAETHDGNLDPASADKRGTYVVAGDEHWVDYRISAQVRSDSKYAIGVMGHYIDPDNYILFSINRRLGYRRLDKRLGGVVTTLWQDSALYQIGQDYRVTLQFSGSQVSVLIDEVSIATAIDGDLTHGKVGLYCWANPGAHFDDIEVVAQEWEDSALFAEDFALPDLAKWLETDLILNTTRSHWQVSHDRLEQTARHPGTALVIGDSRWSDYRFTARVRYAGDGGVGVTYGYQDNDNAYFLFMDQNSMELRRLNAGTVELLWGYHKGLEANSWHTITINLVGRRPSMLLDGQLLTDLPVVAVKGGIGLCTWESASGRFDDVLLTKRVLRDHTVFSDDFSSGMNAWTVIDEGKPSPPAAWLAQDGVLLQTAETHGGSLEPSSPEKPGTYVVCGDETWADYQFTVKLSSNSEYGIGVMFRYVNANNYYRFSMDRRLGYQRLVTVFDGRTTVLKEEHNLYEVGRDYLVTVEAHWDRLRVYIDGVQVFADVIDVTHPQGKIGLYCWGNAGARFTDVTVLAPQFVDYYRFADAERLPAGSVVHVHAGNAQSAIAGETGIEQYYVAQHGERGWPLLDPNGDTLRVINSSGQVVHCRPFLPESNYQPKPISLIRVRDGTAAYLTFPEDGNTVKPGHYRMTMTFHRNTKAMKDPESSKLPVLRRAGSDAPEEATIEFSVPPSAS